MNRKLAVRKCISPPRPRLRDVRESPQVIDAFARQSARRGIPSTEALRELVRAYNAQPWPFEKGLSRGLKSGRWADLRLEQSAVDAFTAHARHHGVSAAEALRQCVRRHLESLGDTQWKATMTPERTSLRNPVVEAKLLELVGQRRSLRQLSAELGASADTISRWKRQLGVGRGSIKATDNPLARPDARERVASLLAQGVSDEVVAEQLGVKFNTFRDWKRRLGLTKPRKRRGKKVSK